MAQEEELQLIGLGPGSGSGPMVSATIGRVMTTLLQAKPKKLQDAISRLQSPLKMAPLTVSLEQSLWFLHKYIGEAAERGEHLDQVLVPIIQHVYADNQSEEPNMSKDSKSDTINFFLNCLLLLLGRLDNQQFGNAITEFGSQISQVLMSQLSSLEQTTHHPNKVLLTLEMDALLATLLDLLDERDAAAKAIVKLVAEYCSICSDSKCLYEVLNRTDSKNVAQRRNAVDIVADLIRISSVSVNALSQAAWTNEYFSKSRGREESESEAMEHENCLFRRLCPLLVIRLLPLRVFDDLDFSLVYGEFPINSAARADGQFSIEGTECIAALMINRALSKSEFEDVRKLASELCGRIHPKVLVPVLSSQLESAADAKDTLKIRVCLFSLCTSLMIRGNNAYRHPDLFRIRKTIQKVLSWTSSDKDEISKAQHGCIDCLALMLCTELQAPQSLKGGAISEDSVLAHVINQLTDDEKDVSVESDVDDCAAEATVHLSFRLCMANVLISACQKIQDTGKKSFVRKILPRVICAVGVTVYPEIRAACIQVLFAVAYHLKSSIFPYSNDLLTIALKSLGEGSYKEKMAGAKLLACLMASEEEVVESISGGLIEARSLLHHLSSTDPWPDVRQMCQQLLLCLTSH
ncbi:UNVERIFIED_CONTAM: hypothetical protein Scaly_0644000 [Sesamum calycinum]|uniref:ARM repeat superfamily protein n=1 Tax=Sesamum calycinum TaxID=2727403 RepID=A0AAW2RTP2_9LAMI